MGIFHVRVLPAPRNDVVVAGENTADSIGTPTYFEGFKTSMI